MNTKIGILYFSLSPELEAVRKRWTTSKRVNLKIAEQLHRSTWTKIQASNLPVLVMDEARQSAQCFGCRISQAIDTAFAEGYDQLIVLGNDCLEISEADIAKAYSNIQQGHSTLGLTKDGGAYLFSISKAYWAMTEFEQLPWCQANLGQALQTYLAKGGSVALLTTKIDLDLLRDIQSFILATRIQLSKCLKGILTPVPTFIVHSIGQWIFPVNKLLLRGPPFAC